MTDPEFIDSPTRPAIRMIRRYPHPIDRVWQAISTPENLRHWFPSEAEIDLVQGGIVRFGFGGDGQVQVIEPPHRLAFTWEEDLLDFELIAENGYTVLTLTHHCGDRAGAASFASGWEQCFVALSAVLADQEPPAPSRFEARHEQLVTRFGLDRPVVTNTDEGWLVRFERQLICAEDVAWKLFFGGKSAPDVGEEFHPFAAPDVVLGTVTEHEEGKVFAFSTADSEPGDAVRLTLAEGTGHGVRLVLEVSGTDPAEVDAAIDQWGGGALGYIVAEAARLAGIS